MSGGVQPWASVRRQSEGPSRPGSADCFRVSQVGAHWDFCRVAMPAPLSTGPLFEASDSDHKPRSRTGEIGSIGNSLNS